METINIARSSSGLRTAAWIEGITLLLLIAIAVPAKHLWGYPIAVTVMGPVHGLAFVYYLWQLTYWASSEGWRAREVIRAVVTALVPFGALLNILLLERQRRETKADGDRTESRP